MHYNLIEAQREQPKETNTLKNSTYEQLGLANIGEQTIDLTQNEKMEYLKKKAIRHFCDHPSSFPTGRPYNCCESVLLALKEYVGEGSSVIPKIGTGIGAGVSLNGLLCGSISSVALLIGMKHGRKSPEENPQPVWSMVDKYVAEFKGRFGHVNCRQLTGLDLKTKEGLQEYFTKVHDYSCADRIGFAVEKALEILEA